MLYMSLCKGGGDMLCLYVREGGDMLYMSLRKGGGRYAIHVYVREGEICYVFT